MVRLQHRLPSTVSPAAGRNFGLRRAMVQLPQRRPWPAPGRSRGARWCGGALLLPCWAMSGRGPAPYVGITAALGPTNTGKTHRAIERMLEHRSGMIGLPLRLLAREVYDKVTARIGEDRVALVTGEEKRVPRRPDYWVCTVEAMPMDRAVDFLAVDEIQLAAHAERGHVFTERLLHARGRKETWFMGADTMRPMFRALLPQASIQSHPRLSRLSGVPPSTLGVQLRRHLLLGCRFGRGW